MNKTNIGIRDANMSDLVFIYEMALESLQSSCISNRKIDTARQKDLLKKTITSLLEISIYNPDFKIKIAYDRNLMDRFGYIIVNFKSIDFYTGKAQAFIQDVAVEAKYRGKPVINRLIEEIVLIAKYRGLKYIVGVVTKSNIRSLETAKKKFGFITERYQIGKML